MAKTEVKYLIGSTCFGVAALVLVIAAFSTTAWVSAVIKPSSSSDDSDDVSHASHGLFSGVYEKNSLGYRKFNIYATCMYTDNVCIWSCLDSESARWDELFNLLYFGNVSTSCIPVSRSIRSAKIQKIDTENLMNAGLWVSTLFFLSGSVAFTAVALGFNVFNVVSNPIELYASIKSVTFYYIVAASCTLLCLILWGVEFAMYTSNNIAVVDTIVSNLITDASLDWSYFLLIPAEISQLIAIALIVYRDYTINKKVDPAVIRNDEQANDANILY